MSRISPVQLTLTLMAWATLFCLPVMGMAANRIFTPKGQYLLSHLNEPAWQILIVTLMLLTLAVLLPAWWYGRTAKLPAVFIYLMALAAISYLGWFAGDYATTHVEHQPRVRCSFGAGFWGLVLILWLISLEASRPLFTKTLANSVMAIIFWLPFVVLLGQSHFQHLSLFIEYHANKSAFDNAFWEHSQIVLLTLALTIVLGLFLGIQSYRHVHFGRICLTILSLLQTIPSIALFGLLLAPLSYLSKQLPWLADLGISGIGTTPAVIALLLYSLLPMVRSTQTGLQQVSPLMIEAAYGMGMSHFQSLWKIQLRLALPVILSGLRITTVQTIGLTMVAALIGAGGFGAIMFRGLSGSAVDLVLLGVIPVVIIAALADTFFKLLVHLSEPTLQAQITTSTIEENARYDRVSPGKQTL